MNRITKLIKVLLCAYLTSTMGACIKPKGYFNYAPSTSESFVNTESLPPEGRISKRLIEALIKVESSGNSKAISHKGAVGLMQIMPSTGRMMGYSRKQLLDPTLNIKAGTRYLNMMLDQTGSIENALAAYYCGPSNYRRKVCKNYAKKVLKVMGRYNVQQEKEEKLRAKSKI